MSNARGALTVVGQIVGAYFGGPVGAAVGGAIGGAVGGAIDGPVRSTQALLDDLSALKADYGSTWPRMYGRWRFKMTPLWTSEKRPVEHEEEVGKGGPAAVNTTFTYEQDWLTWAPLWAKGIARVWINGELKYNVLADADDETLENSANQTAFASITLFDGALDQEPWSVYEAAVGAENAIGYIGRPTVGIESIDLGPSGHPPLIEIEFVGGPTDVFQGGLTKYATSVAQARFFDSNDRPFGSYSLGANGHIAVVSPDGLNTVTTYNVDHDGIETHLGEDSIPAGFDMNTPGRGSGTLALMVFGGFIDTSEANVVTGGPAFAMVGDGISRSVTLPDAGNIIGNSQIRFATYGEKVAIASAADIGYGADDEGTISGQQGRIYVYDLDGNLHDNIAAGIVVDSIALASTQLWAMAGGTIHHYINIGVPASLAGTFAAPSGANHSLFCGSTGDLFCANSDEHVYRYTDGAWELVADLSGSGTDLGTTTCLHAATASQIYVAKGKVIEEEAVKYTWLTSGLSHDDFIPPWPSEDSPYPVAAYHATLLVPDVLGGFERPYRGMSWAITDIQVGSQHAFGSNISGLATVTFNWDNYYYDSPHPDGWDSGLSGPNWQPTSSVFTYHRRTWPIEFQPRYKHDLWRKPFIDTIDPQTVDLADIVKAEALLEWTQEAGPLTEDDIDVSDLVGIPVTGFATTGSPREAIASLMDVFYFQSVCSDKVYFRRRGKASAVSIPFDDTGFAVGRPGEPFTGVERGNDLEVATQVAFTCPGLLRDYEPDTQHSDRLVGESFELRRYDTPVVFSPSQAKGRADTMVQDARTGSHFAKLCLNDAYVAYEPTDVVTVTDDEGSTFRLRIERETLSDAAREFEVVLDDPEDLRDSGITVETDQRSITIATPAETEMVVVDGPIVQDAHDYAGPYVFVSGTGLWPGSQVRRSTSESGTYTNLGTLKTAAVVGETTTALGDGTSSTMFDLVGTLTVNVSGGTLSSATRDAVLDNGANLLAVIKADGTVEYLNFVTATLVEEGVYTLSNLLRGQFGTEHAMTDHAVGEEVVLITTAGALKTQENLSDVGIEHFFKGVTLGRTVESAEAEAFTDAGVALKPYAPVNVRQSASDPLVIQWDRRTRYPSTLPRTTADIPLGEASEVYEVELRDGSDALVDSATLTAAQWTLDAGTYTGHTVTVWQIGQLGRGYPATLSL
jgi:hypothetical protein